MVAVPASTTGTKRVRRYFAEREKALTYVLRVKQQGFLVAEGHEERAAGGKVTLGECASLWIARHEQMRMSFFQVRQVLNRLVERHGRDPIDAVGHRELDTWLRSFRDKGLAPVTIHNHWRITRRFFNWCRDYLEVVSKNPFSKLQEQRLEHQDPEILTPEQMKACLDEAVGNPKLVAYLCLGGFAGMRTEEILRQRWEDIDWEHGEIYVRQPKRVGGWRPRHVEILPALRRHLESVALSEGKVLPGGQRTLYLLRREMMDKLRMGEWPNNCLRHSFRTYHAAHFQDLPKTGLQMGHATIAMTFYRYGASTTRPVAAAWWSL
jgi:integrase